MKKIMLSFFIFILMVFSTYASMNESNSKDILNSKDSTLPKFEYFFNFGVGLANGPGDWEEFFVLTPAILLGTELSLDYFENWSLELICHSWYGKVKSDYPNYLQTKLVTNYYNIKENYYFQYGVSIAIKYYLIGNKYSKFRTAIHFGTMFTLEKHGYNTNDIGFVVLYKVSDNYSIGISYRNLFNISLDFGGGSVSQPAPNLITFNILY